MHALLPGPEIEAGPRPPDGTTAPELDRSREALDALPQGRGFAHVRSMLVAAGALPARDERLTALESWVSEVIADQAKNVRDHVAAAAAFLDWLTAYGLTLGTCTQAGLAQWLAEPPAT